MRSCEKITVLFFLSLLFILPTNILLAQPSDIEFIKVTDTIYEITGGRGARSTLYLGETGVLLIDTKGDKRDMGIILNKIEKMSDKPLLILINTHSDEDHIGGNIYIPQSVTIISHENCRKELFIPLRDGRSTGWEAPERKPFIPEVCFYDSMSIYLGSERIVLRHFGIGHTTGDTVVYFPEQKIAVVGDQYSELPVPYIHDYKGGSPSGNYKNLERMLETLDATTFLSGHSEPVSRKEILNCIDTMKERFNTMRSRINAGETFEDITKGKKGRELNLITAIYNEVKSRK